MGYVNVKELWYSMSGGSMLEGRLELLSNDKGACHMEGDDDLGVEGEGEGEYDVVVLGEAKGEGKDDVAALGKEDVLSKDDLVDVSFHGDEVEDDFCKGSVLVEVGEPSGSSTPFQHDRTGVYLTLNENLKL
ncbi:hypothetical protein LR48_Vigan07g123900 [Vigna angularis]|uniref:Uncharacterized protein n=1 Tax=Phaseolus angularis TaxID=3914 RepID=A0A0L9UXG4_PHAAN|nr:hypothetical protein LR48_Vigan07g123900 [Vigna angularis]